MNDDHAILRETLRDLLADHIEHARAEAAETGFAPELWTRLSEGGFAAAGVPESAGGAGGTLADLAVLLRMCGYHAAPVPLAETNTATLLSAQAGLEIPDGPLAIAELGEHHGCRLLGADDGWRVVGSLRAVPWAPVAHALVVAGQEGHEVLVGATSLVDNVADRGLNLAGEPIADVRLPDGGLALTAVPPTRRAAPGNPRELNTLFRTLLITGSLRRVLALTLRYAREREQFGRPIGAFQAVGHQLAHLAGTAEQSDAIVDRALARMAAGETATDAVLAAKICTGEAAGLAIRIGHQVHGAVGVTQEHELHHYTRRLMAWRDHGGSESSAALALGRRIAQGGADELWSLLTDTRARTA